MLKTIVLSVIGALCIPAAVVFGVILGYNLFSLSCVMWIQRLG